MRTAAIPARSPANPYGDLVTDGFLTDTGANLLTAAASR